MASTFARFCNLVPASGDDEWWYWLGAVNDGGYSVFRLGRRRKRGQNSRLWHPAAKVW
jgi:hypothetical protein